MIGADFVAPSIDWFALSPLLVLLGGGLALLVGAALTPLWPKRTYAWTTVAIVIGALVLTFIQWHRLSDSAPKFLVGNELSWDAFSMFGTITILVAVALASMITDDYLRREGMEGPEVYGLYLMSALGGIVMVMSNDLIVTFLGLETLSIALYVLAASHRKSTASQESGIKYFVLGGFSSAFFLYGIALIYGGTGSTNFNAIIAAFDNVPAKRNDAIVLVGIALLLVGLSFKVAASPFHFWTPDVYQGSPTPVTAFMASVAKAGAFAAMLRVLVIALPTWKDDWQPVIWVIAVLTLLVGSISAVVQTNVKRMLAYSSISHAGFILIGVEAAGHIGGSTGKGMPASMLYLLLYSVLVCGTFGVVSLVSRTGDEATELSSFRGLAKQKPLLALALTVFLLAQAGVPLTSGFTAKFGVIQAAVDQHSYALAIIAMVTSVIGAFLYLRIMISVWMAEPEAGDDAREAIRVPFSTGVAIALCAGFTLLVGFYPGWLIDASDKVVNVARPIVG
ncbi:MAG: nuoN [Ilumatobacteraceae bacterium]|nr:nuoN [Ilumatobacteraceae bacterium]